MAWVRIHDGAMTHPKVLLLNDRAFRLWVWGLTYAQQHLTDGWLPALAIPGVLARGVKDVTAVNLWATVDTGYQIHDYLDWNDSRETVTKKRTEAKDRMAAARCRSANVRANEQPHNQRTSQEVLRGVGISSSGSSLERERERKPLNGADGFERFWAAYPKKKAKDDARKAWAKRNPDESLLAVMLRALGRQQQSPDWQKESGRYVPFPATWLNAGRWTDEAEVNVPSIHATREACEHQPACRDSWSHHRLVEAEASGDEHVIATMRKLAVAS